MLKIDNYIIQAEPMIILETLKQQLELEGRTLFHKFIMGKDNIQFCCPIHNNGQERKPSCGLRITGEQAGVVHCFSCGYTSDLYEMISNCFGYKDDGQFGKRWVSRNFNQATIDDREDLNLGLELKRKPAKPIINFISEKELDSYRYYHPYMYERKMTNEVIEKFDVGFDKATNCITFPVNDESGNCLFIARRSINSKYFNYPSGVEKPVYGIYELKKYAPNAKEVIVCESIIDALTCWTYNVPALALNGTGSFTQFEQLIKLCNLGVRRIIAGFDGDTAGYNATEKLKKSIPNILVQDLLIPEGKDINDLCEEEFSKLFKKLS